MQAYSYEPVTGIYCGPVVVDESPMEPGVYLLPAFSTDQQPPATQPNEIARFDRETGAWSVLPIEPAAPVEAEAPFQSVDSRTARMRAAVQAHADLTAQAYDFDDIGEAVTYADEPAVPRYQVQGKAFRAWRSVLWNAFDSLLAEINAGVAPVPADKDALIDLMPKFADHLE